MTMTVTMCVVVVVMVVVVATAHGTYSCRGRPTSSSYTPHPIAVVQVTSISETQANDYQEEI